MPRTGEPKIQDTHRTKSNSIRLYANLEVKNYGNGKVSGYLVDGDIPGFSQGDFPKKIDSGPAR